MPLIHCDSMPEVNRLPENSAQYAVAGSVHVWQLQLSAHAHRTNELYQLLSPDERLRAGRYSRQKDTTRFIITRGVLRLLMSRYTHIVAREMVIELGDNKKPFVVNAAALHYNVAHAGDWALIAISDRPVGVDTETVDNAPDMAEVIAACMHGEEQDFAGLSPKNFCQCWSRKEALLKGTGKGIDDDLPLVPCLDGNHEVAANIIGSELDWNVVSFDVDEDNVGCVAYDPALGAPVLYKVQNILDYL